MGVTPEQTARQLRVRAESARAAGLVRAQKLLAHTPAIRALLVERFGAQRVWVFGSVVRGDATADSDLDLAVEGLPGTHYFEALGAVMVLCGAAVDLVCLEQAPSSLQERVALEGREL